MSPKCTTRTNTRVQDYTLYASQLLESFEIIMIQYYIHIELSKVVNLHVNSVGSSNLEALSLSHLKSIKHS